jgi:DNA topoisomerase-1
MKVRLNYDLIYKNISLEKLLMNEIKSLYHLFQQRELAMDVKQKQLQQGISRKKVGNDYEYFYIKTNKQVSEKDLKRIKKLILPPAWTDVWVSEDNTSPIQATGIDSKGRKQYRYHEIHIAEADKEKFKRLYDFIKSVPKLEEVMKKHELLPAFDKNRVIVTMLRLVQLLHLRAGKEQYAKKHRSYGVSSLRKKHLKFQDKKIILRFKGKSHQRLFYTLEDHVIQRHLKELLKLGGDHLFQYINESGKIVHVSDADLNQYIQNHIGNEYVVKDFRTMGANVQFIKALLKETVTKSPMTAKRIKKNILNALKKTSEKLKHTKSVAKSSYILNFAMELYQTNPEFFVQHKLNDPTRVLLEIIKLYKKNILKET